MNKYCIRWERRNNYCSESLSELQVITLVCYIRIGSLLTWSHRMPCGTIGTPLVSVKLGSDFRSKVCSLTLGVFLSVKKCMIWSATTFPSSPYYMAARRTSWWLRHWNFKPKFPRWITLNSIISSTLKRNWWLRIITSIEHSGMLETLRLSKRGCE